METLPSIALDTWSWGVGMAGGDQVFGNHTATIYQRAMTYNPILPKLDELIAGMRKIGDAHDASVSQVAIAYAINKGTYPIIGVTKPRHVEEAAVAAKIKLTEAEISTLESLAEATGVDTKGSWGNYMA